MTPPLSPKHLFLDDNSFRSSVDCFFQVITPCGDSQEIVTEEVEAAQIIHDEALPLDVSNAWFVHCEKSDILALNLSLVENSFCPRTCFVYIYIYIYKLRYNLTNWKSSRQTAAFIDY
jgi:hypothetical protein